MKKLVENLECSGQLGWTVEFLAVGTDGTFAAAGRQFLSCCYCNVLWTEGFRGKAGLNGRYARSGDLSLLTQTFYSCLRTCQLDIHQGYNEPLHTGSFVLVFCRKTCTCKPPWTVSFSSELFPLAPIEIKLHKASPNGGETVSTSYCTQEDLCHM